MVRSVIPMDTHRSQIADRPMPDDVAETFAVALGLASPPATLGDWIDLTAKRLDAAGISFGVEELCLTETSPHRARIDDEAYFFDCVLDTLLLPFVRDDSDEVDVRTRSPVSGTVIEATVTPHRITVDPPDAVMSFGISGDAGPPEECDGVLASGLVQFCPYINAFADRAEYDRWAAETNEAVTMALPLEDGFALASALYDRLTTDQR